MLETKHSEASPPWYFNYPTAPQFSAAIGAETYGEWLGGLPANDSVSLYIHIPFSRSMCWYCGCPTTITRRDAPIQNYVAALRDEIRLVSELTQQALPVSDVHFGGGTPTLVGPKEFLALMEFLRRCFAFRQKTAIAVEINPRTFSAETAEALGAAGVNRASLGVQSFDPFVQKVINRIQSVEQTAIAVEYLRQQGISRINIDLIYGLPNQTMQCCVQTATVAVAMRRQRLAVLGYAHAPSSNKHQRFIEKAALPDSAARAEQAAAVAETLVAAGYREIAFDHFALPDDELALAQKNGRLRRNSQGYSAETCKTLIAFGASAIARVGEGYVENEAALDGYSQHIAASRLATSKGYRLTGEDRVRGAIIERLMCDLEADVPAICAAHGFDWTHFPDSAERLAMLAEHGMVDVENGFIRVRHGHRILLRSVAAAFDAYLDQS